MNGNNYLTPAMNFGMGLSHLKVHLGLSMVRMEFRDSACIIEVERHHEGLKSVDIDHMTLHHWTFIDTLTKDPVFVFICHEKLSSI